MKDANSKAHKMDGSSMKDVNSSPHGGWIHVRRMK